VPDLGHNVRERISAHIRASIARVFSRETSHEYLLILEDDLEFSPDFMTFILSFLPHLATSGDSGETRAVCVSGWNDNGASPASVDQSAASRTSYFPGLGWALSRGLWLAVLHDIWPISDAHADGISAIVGTGWDYWLRSEFDARGWSCVTPDVPRVFHFGGSGSANVGFEERAARFDVSRLADEPYGAVDWADIATKIGSDSVGYDARLFEEVASASVVFDLSDSHIADLEFDDGESAEESVARKHYVLLYRWEEYIDVAASALNLWPSPRGHYHHILSMRLKHGRTLHLIDARRASTSFLPLHLQNTAALPEHASLSAAPMGISCAIHCVSLHLKCNAEWLAHGNDCRSLQKHFRCSRCAYETGYDLPAYVVPLSGGNLATEGLCLITDGGFGQLDCDSSFRFTQRLCACGIGVPSRSSSDDYDAGEL
jgi:GNT-I family